MEGGGGAGRGEGGGGLGLGAGLGGGLHKTLQNIDQPRECMSCSVQLCPHVVQTFVHSCHTLYCSVLTVQTRRQLLPLVLLLTYTQQQHAQSHSSAHVLLHRMRPAYLDRGGLGEGGFGLGVGGGRGLGRGGGGLGLGLGDLGGGGLGMLPAKAVRGSTARVNECGLA